MAATPTEVNVTDAEIIDSPVLNNSAAAVLVSSSSGGHIIQVADGDGDTKRRGYTVAKVEADTDSDDSDSLPFQSAGGATLLGHNDPMHNAPTLVQYTQTPDGQFYIPVSTLGAGSLGYQLSSASGGVVMTTASPGLIGTEEVSRKRELRLLKNREAARECRRKKKEYIKCLENRVALLENQNKTLIEELKSLKELYCQKDLGAS